MEEFNFGQIEKENSRKAHKFSRKTAQTCNRLIPKSLELKCF